VEVVTNYFLFLFFWGPLVFSVCMGSAIASLTPAVEALRGSGMGPKTLLNTLGHYFL